MASPNWLKFLFGIRNKIAKLVGLKTNDLSGHKNIDPNTDIAKHNFSVGETLGLFKVYNITEKEVVLGLDDKHLDFRASLLLDQNLDENKILKNDHRSLTISTKVKYNNLFGKIYFMPVKPFHRKIVPSMLKETIKHLECH